MALRVSLADLLRRRFHPERLRARTLRFRLRERLAPGEATPARLARYPRIEGFADPPLLPTTPAPAKPARAPWRVVIDDLAVANVEEIWIDSWRWTGKGSVTGSFELLPGREAQVGPARLEVTAGELLHGESKVAYRTRGAVWCELPRFEAQDYPGNEVWKILSGGSRLRGEVAGLEFLSVDSGGHRLSGGAGSLLLRIGLKAGAGSARASLTAHDVTVREGNQTARGTVRVELLAPRLDFPRGEASLSGTRVVLSRVAVDEAPGRPWAASFSAPTARLLFADGSLDAGLVGDLLDARPIVALMPSGLPRWLAGLLHLQDLHVTGDLATGPSRLALTSLHLSAGDFSLAGDYRSRPGRKDGDFRAKKGPFSFRFTVPGER